MPAPIPVRNRRVVFAGAGLSKALGLPNTAELLDGVLELATRHTRWSITEDLPTRIEAASLYFYPDAEQQGFRPDVVDFFSALRTYIDVGAGLSGGFPDAAELFRALKFAIAHMLMERLKDPQAHLRLKDHSYLEDVVKPGNIVITSNWDLVFERYAVVHDIPMRLRGYDENEFVLLKLHGSMDWCTVARRSSRYGDANFSGLTERMFGASHYRLRVPRGRQEIVRIQALENWGRAWGHISSRASDLHMVTMARGKSGDLGPLRPVWRDAYDALSRAREVEIVGYSLPPDDIEIRTLLRAALRRGRGPKVIRTRNPSPDVHERVWRYISRTAESDYRAIDSR